MLSALLVIHILFMSTSVLAAIAMLLVAISGRSVRAIYLHSSTAITTFGVMSGLVLLLQSPIAIKCIVLSAYIAGYYLVQRYVARSNQRLTPSVEL